jgi:hypothetical protein
MRHAVRSGGAFPPTVRKTAADVCGQSLPYEGND